MGCLRGGALVRPFKIANVTRKQQTFNVFRSVRIVIGRGRNRTEIAMLSNGKYVSRARYGYFKKQWIF